MAVPSALKKIRRGPSELKVSTTLAAVNGLGDVGPASTAATPNELAALVAAWPCVSPSVAIWRRPRLVATCRKRGAAATLLTTTMRWPTDAVPPICSNGSCVPFWTFSELPRTTVPVPFKRNKS